MKSFTKALTGTIAAGAMAVSSATPAFARDGHDGGTGAVTASVSIGRDGGYAYDRAGYGDYANGDLRGGRWGERGGFDRGNPRGAVAQCIRAAEYQASRFSYGRATVTDVRDVRGTRWGYEVRGRIAVNTNGRDWHREGNDHGRGWGGDNRGWNSQMRGYDSGSFRCTFERGRIADLDLDGIRGL